MNDNKEIVCFIDDLCSKDISECAIGEYCISNKYTHENVPLSSFESLKDSIDFSNFNGLFEEYKKKGIGG